MMGGEAPISSPSPTPSPAMRGRGAKNDDVLGRGPPPRSTNSPPSCQAAPLAVPLPEDPESPRFATPA